MLRRIIKYLASLSPIALTKNEFYDRLTEQVIQETCLPVSICIDVGANNGKILAMMIKHCPGAIHYAFEPVGDLYFLLVRKYGSAAKIYTTAITDKKGTATFYYVNDDAAYSSLRSQMLDQSISEKIVETNCLDNLVGGDEHIQLIKLDIEGGEYHAIIGAKNLIEKCTPIILFEFGKGGADAFEVSPTMMFELLAGLGYRINLLDRFLKNKDALAFEEFERTYRIGKEYFFVAYPA